MVRTFHRPQIDAHREVLLLVFQLFDPDSFVSGAAYVLPLSELCEISPLWGFSDTSTSPQQINISSHTIGECAGWIFAPVKNIRCFRTTWWLIKLRRLLAIFGWKCEKESIRPRKKSCEIYRDYVVSKLSVIVNLTRKIVDYYAFGSAFYPKQFTVHAL